MQKSLTYVDIIKTVKTMEDEIIQNALTGNREALDQLILQVKDQVYNLSLKMLFEPEDAKDASQEILVRMITHLSSFRGESRFETWLYRLATNYLITTKNKAHNKLTYSFDEYGELIDSGQSDVVTYAKNDGELFLLEEEVKVSCTHGLLHCLNVTDRMVYILGEILDFDGVQGSEILEMTPTNFRKRLSRSRVKIRGFLSQKCGIMKAQNACRCKKKIDHLIVSQLVDAQNLRFAQHTQRSIDLIDTIEEVERSAAIFRSVPMVEAPLQLINDLKDTLNKLAS